MPGDVWRERRTVRCGGAQSTTTTTARGTEANAPDLPNLPPPKVLMTVARDVRSINTRQDVYHREPQRK